MDMVTEFHEKFGHPVCHVPMVPKEEDFYTRIKWLTEELKEGARAVLIHEDPIEFADALGDAVYIIYGFAVTCGIDLDRVIEVIHKSNMTKLDSNGKPIYADDGKIGKGPHYKEPTEDIRRILYGHPSHKTQT